MLQEIKQFIIRFPSKRILRLVRYIVMLWPFPVPVTLSNGIRLYVDFRSSTSREIYIKGTYDPAVAKEICEGLSADSTFIDVGANVGFYSILAWDSMGRSGEVYAFEIDRRAIRSFQKTLRVNNINNIYLYPIAVGRTQGRGFIRRKFDSACTEIIETDKQGDISIISLDEFFKDNNLDKLRLIKIDVEGTELFVLEGAKRLINKYKPKIICEAYNKHTKRHGYQVLKITSLLRSWGYKVNNINNAETPCVIAGFTR